MREEREATLEELKAKLDEIKVNIDNIQYMGLSDRVTENCIKELNGQLRSVKVSMHKLIDKM